MVQEGKATTQTVTVATLKFANVKKSFKRQMLNWGGGRLVLSLMPPSFFISPKEKKKKSHNFVEKKQKLVRNQNL